MTEAQKAALDKWAEIVGEVTAITEFVQWATSSGNMTWKATMKLDTLLDVYYGINRTDLESARRALLAEARGEKP